MKRCRHCHHSERAHYPQGCWVLVNATRQMCGCRAMVWAGYEEEEQRDIASKEHPDD